MARTKDRLRKGFWLDAKPKEKAAYMRQFTARPIRYNCIYPCRICNKVVKRG